MNIFLKTPQDFGDLCDLLTHDAPASMMYQLKNVQRVPLKDIQAAYGNEAVLYRKGASDKPETDVYLVKSNIVQSLIQFAIHHTLPPKTQRAFVTTLQKTATQAMIARDPTGAPDPRPMTANTAIIGLVLVGGGRHDLHRPAADAMAAICHTAASVRPDDEDAAARCDMTVAVALDGLQAVASVSEPAMLAVIDAIKVLPHDLRQMACMNLMYMPTTIAYLNKSGGERFMPAAYAALNRVRSEPMPQEMYLEFMRHKLLSVSQAETKTEGARHLLGIRNCFMVGGWADHPHEAMKLMMALDHTFRRQQAMEPELYMMGIERAKPVYTKVMDELKTRFKTRIVAESLIQAQRPAPKTKPTGPLPGLGGAPHKSQ